MAAQRDATAPDSIQQRMLAQRPLIDAANIIPAAVEALPADSGYTNITLGHDVVELRWAGPVPASVHSAVDAARKQVKVQIVTAAHSMAQLRAAAQPLIDEVRRNPTGAFHSVIYAGDGSGLQVVTDNPANLNGTALLPKTSVPVTVKVGKSARTRATRRNDSPGYNSGGYAHNITANAWCTTGFGVWKSGGGEGILTAGHCGQPNDVFVDGVGDAMGTATREHVGHDLMLINANAHHWMFDGTADTSSTKAVGGWDYAYIGQYVCQSGIASGTVCGLMVDLTYAIMAGQDARSAYEVYTDLIHGIQQEGREAAKGGDSGGPVFTYRSDGRVNAVGVLSGSWDADVFFQDFATARADFNVSIQTGY